MHTNIYIFDAGYSVIINKFLPVKIHFFPICAHKIYLNGEYSHDHMMIPRISQRGQRKFHLRYNLQTRSIFHLLSYKVPTNKPTPCEKSGATEQEAISKEEVHRNEVLLAKQAKKIRKQTEENDLSSDHHIKIFEISSMLRSIDNGLELKDVEVEKSDLRLFYKSQPGNLIEPVTVKIIAQSSTGEGIGVIMHNNKNKVVFVPFAIKGDTVKVVLGRHFKYYAEATILEITTKSIFRRDNLVSCEYFGKCSGCQFQMIPYNQQLVLKQDTIKQAYEIFFGNKESKDGNPSKIELPEIGDVIPSPLQLSYRSKLTPHFKKPRNNQQLSIGFNQTGRLSKSIIDVNRCSISSPIINEGLTMLRDNVKRNIESFKNGSTLLIKESFTDFNCEERYPVIDTSTEIIEKINDKVFQYSSSSFFQVNTSILPLIIDYISSFIDTEKTRFLVDTYCGSGFFGISLNEKFEKILGIEISNSSVKAAKVNSDINNLTNIDFIEGEADKIFDSIDFDSKKSVVIIDPSRKGSSEEFLNQLSVFQPQLIVYVSCNVFTQARDLRTFASTVNGSKYKIRDIRGFDFFPQTKHVESVAILEHVA